ncbi:flagellar basal-body rod protein FlgG [Aneurinibacillus soli]|uniref:Flagellar basal-body rod protein FlgG n=1 Tax=Aneurinibacillus soli TaxID=1500254 RepID=A0A0U5B697_9BACL|nr:flagellar hook-basal body protein [Aneurinibacillus soli]PYE61553.1 flagellar basal-body rod protein FlgG [Aneurinibacillus soli]BAU26492.1 Flagellar basal-body rod protein FlgG [Aneurinibacillus soli]
MLRGLDAAASGMMANQARQDALTNNLANVNTPGYKTDNAAFRSFPEVLIERIRDMDGSAANGLGSKQILGQLTHGVYNQELVPNFAQGDALETGKELNFAIEDGMLAPQVIDGRSVQPRTFFKVQKPGENGGAPEIFYTRSGNWTMNAAGYLATPEGYEVLNANNQPINLRTLLGNQPLSKKTLVVTPQGQLTAPLTPSSQPVQLGIVRVDNPALTMIKEMDTAFRYTGAGQPAAFNPLRDAAVSIKQGYVERSNVDAGRTMTDMMNVIRSYEANQKVLSAYDTTLQKLAEVARV